MQPVAPVWFAGVPVVFGVLTCDTMEQVGVMLQLDSLAELDAQLYQVMAFDSIELLLVPQLSHLL